MIARSNHTRGFTLIELMLVILILAMLGGLGIMAYSGVQDRAAIKTSRHLVRTVVPGALEQYKVDIHHYPTEAEGGLKALTEKPEFEKPKNAENWRPGGYLKQTPKDAWGNELNYEEVPGEEGALGSFKLSSNGPDEEPDTDDDIKYPPEQDEEV